MHFTTLFIIKGAKLEDLSTQEIERTFGERFCYDCGQTKPRYKNWCDWFQIGGRWCDILKADKGIHCERNWSNDNAAIVEGNFSIVEIKDLTEKLPRNMIYSVATKSRIYIKNEDYNCGEVNPKRLNELLNQIDNKKFEGVVAVIDCHD